VWLKYRNSVEVLIHDLICSEVDSWFGTLLILLKTGNTQDESYDNWLFILCCFIFFVWMFSFIWFFDIPTHCHHSIWSIKNIIMRFFLFVTYFLVKRSFHLLKITESIESFALLDKSKLVKTNCKFGFYSSSSFSSFFYDSKFKFGILLSIAYSNYRKK